MEFGGIVQLYMGLYIILLKGRKVGLLSQRIVNGDYEKVQAIDGLIMVTQYDLSVERRFISRLAFL